MSITYIRNLAGRETERGLPNDSTLRRRWLVLTDTRYTSEALFLADCITTGAGAIPVPYISFHPDDITHLCKRLRGRQDQKSPLHWTLEAEYDTKPWQDDDEEEAPLDRRAKIQWSTVKYQKAVERDRDDEAILNAAGDYFDPPPLKDTSRWTVTVSKNLSVVPTDILDYPDKLNNASWSIGGVTALTNAAKIMSISVSDLQKEQDEEFYIFTYTVEFDKDLWKGKYLNQGFYYLDSGTRKRAQVNGKDSASPVILTSSGTVNATPTPSNAWFMQYDVYEQMDFSVLPTT